MKFKKAYLQMSFAWIFAIIVGAFILFLAIFAVVKLTDTEQTAIDAQTGKEIEVLLNPLETSFQSAESTSLTIPAETRIYNKCDNSGFFGKQKIQISQKSFNKWSKTDIDIVFPNKYIFSKDYVEGKKFYLFSKPFNFPFKVADLIYMTSSKNAYCFINPPDDIKDEISRLNQANLLTENCPDPDFDETDYKNIINVCFSSFGSEECDIEVDYNSERVTKNNENVYFKGDVLMYAAIFAEPEIYECQLKRVMQRVENLALLYKDKALFVSQKAGCNSNLNLIGLNNAANSFSNSANLNSVKNIADEIENNNDDNWECKLW